MNLYLQWWKNDDDWLRRSRDILILVERHKNVNASSNMYIRRSTVYEGCSIHLQPIKVQADVLYIIAVWHVWWSTQLMNIPRVWSYKHFLFFRLLNIATLLDLANGEKWQNHFLRSSATLVTRAKPSIKSTTRLFETILLILWQKCDILLYRKFETQCK